MYFIILVMSWYVFIWSSNAYKELSTGMNSNRQYTAHAIWGIVVHGIKGFTLGYALWFIYYCVINYPYHFL